MRTALAVTRVTADTGINLENIWNAMTHAAQGGASLVVLPEAALTGLANDGDPSHDLPLGREIPGPVTDALGAHARQCHIWAAVGLLEREDGALYDSAVLICPSGEIELHYRRIQPQWHARNADPLVYKQGSAVGAADTELGRIAIIICGDLFDEAVTAQVRAIQPDLLLMPFARCFCDSSYDQERWEDEEQPEYLWRARSTGCTVLMVNYLSSAELGGYFGGALAVSSQGEIINSLPLGVADTLFVDLPGISEAASANAHPS